MQYIEPLIFYDKCVVFTGECIVFFFLFSLERRTKKHIQNLPDLYSINRCTACLAKLCLSISLTVSNRSDILNIYSNSYRKQFIYTIIHTYVLVFLRFFFKSKLLTENEPSDFRSNFGYVRVFVIGSIDSSNSDFVLMKKKYQIY